jgi:hypothetical protein
VSFLYTLQLEKLYSSTPKTSSRSESPTVTQGFHEQDRDLPNSFFCIRGVTIPTTTNEIRKLPKDHQNLNCRSGTCDLGKASSKSGTEARYFLSMCNNKTPLAAMSGSGAALE